MFTQILWWTGNALEFLILVRAVKEKSFLKYPVFYLYLSSVLLVDLGRFAVYTLQPQFHPVFYWYSEVVVALVSYFVIIEIYARTLSDSPGLARLGRIFLWSVLGLLIFKVMLGGANQLAWPLTTVWTELERNLRTIQAILLAGIIVILVYYAIPVGRNLTGIIFGYSLYTYASVVSLAFGSLPGHAPSPGWRLVLPIAYLAALVIWVLTLWTRSPFVKAQSDPRIDRDYKLIAEHTRKALSSARALLKMRGEL